MYETNNVALKSESLCFCYNEHRVLARLKYIERRTGSWKKVHSLGFFSLGKYEGRVYDLTMTVSIIGGTKKKMNETVQWLPDGAQSIELAIDLWFTGAAIVNNHQLRLAVQVK